MHEADIKSSLQTNTRAFELMEDRGKAMRHATRQRKEEYDRINKLTESQKKLAKANNRQMMKDSAAVVPFYEKHMNTTRYLDKQEMDAQRKMRESLAQDAAYIDGKCLLKNEAWTVAADEDERKAEREAEVRALKAE